MCPTQEEILAVVYLTSITLLDGNKAVVTKEGEIDMVRILDHETGEQKEYRPLGNFEKLLFAQMIHIRDYREQESDLYPIRSLPSEPYFVLLGRDPQAPELVQKWAVDRAIVEPDDWKVPNALTTVEGMQKWKLANPTIGLSLEAYAQIKATNKSQEDKAE